MKGVPLKKFKWAAAIIGACVGFSYWATPAGATTVTHPTATAKTKALSGAPPGQITTGTATNLSFATKVKLVNGQTTASMSVASKVVTGDPKTYLGTASTWTTTGTARAPVPIVTPVHSSFLCTAHIATASRAGPVDAAMNLTAAGLPFVLLGLALASTVYIKRRSIAGFYRQRMAAVTAIVRVKMKGSVVSPAGDTLQSTKSGRLLYQMGAGGTAGSSLRISRDGGSGLTGAMQRGGGTSAGERGSALICPTVLAFKVC